MKNWKLKVILCGMLMVFAGLSVVTVLGDIGVLSVSAAESAYVLREHEGYVAVFSPPEESPMLVTDIRVQELPADDRMPQMPTEGQMPQMPQQGGNMPQMPQQGGGMAQMPDMGRGEIGAVRPEAPAAAENGSPVLAIVCAAVLVLGLAIALLYKRR